MHTICDSSKFAEVVSETFVCCLTVQSSHEQLEGFFNYRTCHLFLFYFFVPLRMHSE